MKTRSERIIENVNNNPDRSLFYAEAFVDGQMDAESKYDNLKYLWPDIRNNKMTFEDKVESLKKFYNRNDAACFLGALEALGLIKFEEPKVKVKEIDVTDKDLCIIKRNGVIVHSDLDKT